MYHIFGAPSLPELQRYYYIRHLDAQFELHSSATVIQMARLKNDIC